MDRGAAEHPDLALLRSGGREPVCCLALAGADAAQLRALDVLAPFHAYARDGRTALLFTRPQAADWQAALEALLRDSGLQAGLSGPFALTASAMGCMRKAELALQTGRRVAPERALLPMDEYGEEALLHAAAQALAREGFVCGDFCDACAARMAAMDAREGTQYAASLRAYLRHGLDMKRAAQALGVHRNTLAYRMKRAQEIFSIDLTDVNTCFELMFTFFLADRLTIPQDGRAHGAQLPDDGAPFDAAAAQAALWRHVERGADALQEEAQARFGCALLAVGVSALADGGRTTLLAQLRSLAPGPYACAFDEDALLFALPPGEMAAFATACRPLCEARGCVTAVTQAFPACRLAHRARLCRMALCAAGRPHVRTQDMLSTLFFMTLERSFSLAPYLCEDVVRVMDDDATRGAALSRALYAYLLNFRDMKRAAQQLGVHRNTLEYQLRKIEALIGSMDGEARRLRMMCTYKMLALPEARRFGAW